MTPFQFHTGKEPTPRGPQYVMQCPFCQKDDHFYFDAETNLWDCKVCLQSGNIYSFISDILDLCRQDVEPLAKEWDIPVRYLREANIRFNPLNQTWVIPTYRIGKLNNLYKYTPEINKIFCTPGIEHTLFNWEEEIHPEVWICEGHKDKLAGEAICGETHEVSLVGVPGAGVFKESWCSVFRDRKLVLIYDNDKPGREGMAKLIEKHIHGFAQKPAEIYYVDWDGKPDKYDLRDFYKEYGRKSYKLLQERMVKYVPPSGVVVTKPNIETVIEDKSIDTFEKFLEVFRETYHTTDDMEMGLLLIFASIFSIRVEGEQIWIRFIGVPGSGKSTIAKAVSATEQVVLRSTFTGLFSGWYDGEKKDNSLVPIISGKTLVIKDADALLRQPNIEKIFSELRDFYDKDSSVSYRTGISYDYRNIRSTVILCGTQALRRSDNSFLGERFLDFEFVLRPEDAEAIYDKAEEVQIKAALNKDALPPETRVMAAAKGFCNHLMEREVKHPPSPEMRKMIRELSILVSKMRTKVDRDRRSEVTFHPKEELATRISKQLIKLAMCVPAVINREDDAVVLALTKHIVTSILDKTSNRYKICNLLLESDPKPLTAEEIMFHTEISKRLVYEELDNLRLLEFVVSHKVPTGVGRAARGFTLAEDIKRGMKRL